MTNRKTIIILVTALIIVASGLIMRAWQYGEQAQAFLDITNIRADSIPAVASASEVIRAFEGRVKRDPIDFISLTTLGRMHMRKGQQTGDVTSYLRAEASLRKALQLQQSYVPAQTYLASVLYSQHRFEEALNLSRKVYEVDPKYAQALATLGDAYQELGRYEESEDAYLELIRTGPSPAILARLAYSAFLRGQPEEAMNLMQRSLLDALESGQTKESVAWYLVRLGDLHFDEGRIDESAEHYEASLRVSENYYIALSRLGRTRAAQGRYDDAIELYERAIAIVPQPKSLAALGDLYARTGDSRKATLQYDTVAVIATLAAINKQVYNRELALFYADHDIELVKALELAENEMAVRKDIYGYDALAWTLYKNNRLDEAKQAIASALSLGTEDANLYYHAGMIYYGMGLEVQAQEYLGQALSINPYFSLLQADIAHSTLKTIDQSLAIAPSVTGRTSQ